MITAPLPDLAASLRLQDQASALRARLDAAAQEMTTGLSADIRARTGGDLAPLFGIDRSLGVLERLQDDLALAGARAGAAQAALGSIDGMLGTTGLDLLAALRRGDAVAAATFRAEAASAYDGVMEAINVEFGGRSLFSGAAEDRNPLADPAALLADMRAILAAAPDAATAAADIDAYFDAPGGAFETLVYAGATVDGVSVALPDGSRAPALPRADAAEFRTVIKSLAMLAAAESGGIGGDTAEMAAFIADAAARLQASETGIVALQGRIGIAEERIATGIEEAEAERNALGISRNTLAGVDPYQAAARLADLEGQMQSLYVVTARLSALSLTNYIR